MSGDVRAALEAARDAAAELYPRFDVRFANECSRDDGEVAMCDAFVAAIAAFLRALPANLEIEYHLEHQTDLQALAAAVTAAAREGSE